MRFYVDYENVNANGLKGARFLKKSDIVRIYYSKDPNIDLDSLREIVRCKARLELQKMPDRIKALNQKNALDIIILMDIYRAAANKTVDEIVVISHDCGFDPPLAELTDREHIFMRYASIEQCIFGVGRKVDLNAVNRLFTGELSKYVKFKPQIIEIISENYTRKSINEAMQKSLHSQIAPVIIQAIKPYIKNLPGE